MKKYITLLLILLVVTIVSVKVFWGYWINHTYYIEILLGGTNWKLLLAGLAGVIVPLLVLFRRKSVSFLRGWSSVVIGLYLFMMILLATLNTLPGLGFLKLLFNTLVMATIATYFVVGVTVLGGVIRSYWHKYDAMSITKTYIDFGIGLLGFLIVVYLLALLGLVSVYSAVVLFVGLGALCWFNRPLLSSYKNQLAQTRQYIVDIRFTRNEHYPLIQSIFKILLWVVIIVGIWYLFNAYQMAYLPYPTAWDANHAYFFYPKMWALNGGVYWTEASMNVIPRLWDMFIMFRFSIGELFSWLTGIAPDTYALIMNMLSGPFVIIGISLAINAALKLLGSDQEGLFHRFAVVIGTLLSLSFFTSGMGAFLLFVDNKTDVGMLVFVVLGILLGFKAIRHFIKEYKLTRSVSFFTILSGLFFTAGALVKPTAMFDVMSFGIVLWWFFLGIISAVGLIIVVIGVLSYFKMMSIVDYFSQKTGVYSSLVGAILAFLGLPFKKLSINAGSVWKSVQFMLLWVGTILVSLFVLKGLYVIPDAFLMQKEYSPKDYFQRIFLVQASDEDLGSTVCSLDSLGLQSTEQLYDGLVAAEYRTGYSEDFGRYVGFGRKGGYTDRDNGPYYSKLAKFIPAGCYGKGDSKLLCDNYDGLLTLDVLLLEQLQGELEQGGSAYESISQILADYDQVEDEQLEDKIRFFSEPLLSLLTIAESDTVKVIADGSRNAFYIPYKYLNFFNMTYNWSIQNSMSYYTDIGFQWLILLSIVLIGLIYAIVTKKKLLTVLLGVSLFSRILWHFVASGIVWYNLGMIVWLIVACCVLLYSVLNDMKEDNDLITYFLGPVLLLLSTLVVFQILINMLRIVSLVPRLGDTFLYYKSNRTTDSLLDNTMQRTRNVRGSYNQADVFKSQFPHYEKLVESANNRNDNEGVWIAGTYARYFIDQQNNTRYEQMLTWLQGMMSDGDECKTYLRLLDQNKNYLVMDLNIGTVVQGEGNRSLFDRFFGRVNSFTNELESDGVISMFTKLIDEGYVRLVSTSNIGSYYAWTLSDSAFNSIPEQQRVLFKSRMAVARYLSNSGPDNPMIKTIVDIADQRVESGLFLEDIAQVMGVEVRGPMMRELLSEGVLREQDIVDLTMDERYVLEMYVYFNQRRSQSPEQYRAELTNFVIRSVYSVSQIVVLELL